MSITHSLSIYSTALHNRNRSSLKWVRGSNGIATSPVSHSFPRLLLMYGHWVWCNMEVQSFTLRLLPVNTRFCWMYNTDSVSMALHMEYVRTRHAHTHVSTNTRIHTLYVHSCVYACTHQHTQIYRIVLADKYVIVSTVNRQVFFLYNECLEVASIVC